MIIALLAAMIFAVPVAATEPSAEGPPKVAIIVGPVGALTPTYIDLAEKAADAAFEAGAEVQKAYSPNATPERVLAAVQDANIIIYFGHGSGYRDASSGFNPFTSNGWGLQGPNAYGTHADSWVDGTLRYYGEDWIVANARPAPGFVMIYSNACYAPGASEGSLGPATPADARQRVNYYSRGVLNMGASAYFATDFYAGAARLVSTILTSPNMTYGDIFRSDPLFAFGELEQLEHPSAEGRQMWLHRSRYFYGQLNYWYAFAGDPNATPADSGVDARQIVFDPERELRIEPGSHVGYKFDEDNEVASQHVAQAGIADSWQATLNRLASATLDGEVALAPQMKPETATTNERVRLDGQDGYWFAITSGEWKGYYLQESPDVYLPGVSLRTTLWPERTVKFAAGEYTGYQFDENGDVTDTKTVEFEHASSAPAAARAIVNGERNVLLSDGAFEDYWVAESEQVVVQALPTPELPPYIALENMPETSPDAPINVRIGFGAGAGAEATDGDSNDTSQGQTSEPVGSGGSTSSGGSDPSATPAPSGGSNDGSGSSPAPTPAPSTEPVPSTEPAPLPTLAPAPLPTLAPLPTVEPAPLPTPAPLPSNPLDPILDPILDPLDPILDPLLP